MQRKGPVFIEALRLARGLIKDEIKRQGGKVSHIESTEVNKAALKLIKECPEITERAKRNCKALNMI